MTSQKKESVKFSCWWKNRNKNRKRRIFFRERKLWLSEKTVEEKFEIWKFNGKREKKFCENLKQRKRSTMNLIGIILIAGELKLLHKTFDYLRTGSQSFTRNPITWNIFLIHRISLHLELIWHQRRRNRFFSSKKKITQLTFGTCWWISNWDAITRAFLRIIEDEIKNLIKFSFLYFAQNSYEKN